MEKIWAWHPGMLADAIPGDYCYERIGLDARDIVLEEAGGIGRGAAGCEQRWAVHELEGIPTLVIVGKSREGAEFATMFLQQDKQGVWCGRWAVYERCPIRLTRKTSLRIAIATPYIGEKFRKRLAPAIESKYRYAERWSYSCHIATLPVPDGRSLTWAKIPLVESLLPSHDWVFCSDADTVITNRDVRLETIIARYPGFDLIAAGDSMDPCNAGQFFIRNCAWSFGFLREWWDLGPGKRKDQEAYNAVVAKYPEHVTIAPQREFNSFSPTAPEAHARWKPGDFLIHVVRAGRTNDPNIEKFAARFK